MKKFILISLLVLVGLIGLLVTGFVTITSVRFARERRESDAAWNNQRPGKLEGLGSVKSLRIVPLVEGDATNPDLKRGIGVSYAILAGDTTILFDVAGNPVGEPRPPALTNADKIGLDIGKVNFVVISHLHRDHVGDLADILADPAVGEHLARIPILVPEPMSLAGAHARVIDGPTVLAPGIASIGPIAKSYWGMGTVVEQALAINLDGKGVVLVVGCGHQSVERIIARTGAIFDAPLYGVIGGLHYPITGFAGVPKAMAFMMRLGASGEQPWHGPLTKQDVRAAITLLQARNLGVVGISPHDSCAWTIDQFKTAFADRYCDIKAGGEMVIQM